MPELLHDEIGATGTRSRVWFDEVEGLFHIEHIDDVEPLMERNKSALNGHSGWLSDRTGECADGDLRHVASIPNVVLTHLLSRGIDVFDLEDERSQRALKILLNSSDYRHFRTTPGVV